MARAKSPPRVKGPYCERDGSRFRIRVCDLTGHRDLYFSTMSEAQAGIKQAVPLKVRDLDCGGTRLWVAAQDSEYRGKTHNAARNPEVPEVLRPRLLQRTVGMSPEDYLFGAGCNGRPKSRQALHGTVRRVCLAAGVPVVCPHSLRGLWATAGVRSGALSHTVAAALGHGSFKVTAKHYVQPGTLEGERTEQLMQLLGRMKTEREQDPASLQAEQLLASLPAETLARLLELAAGRTSEPPLSPSHSGQSPREETGPPPT